MCYEVFYGKSEKKLISIWEMMRISVDIIIKQNFWIRKLLVEIIVNLCTFEFKKLSQIQNLNVLYKHEKS